MPCGGPSARAKELGACVLAFRNSSHIGRIGTYAELAAAEGCAFTAFVNVADHHDVQATWQAAEPRLGTNPFCVGGAGNRMGRPSCWIWQPRPSRPARLG